MNIKSILDSHDKTRENFINEGVRIIELACNAYDKYLSQPNEEKAEFLKIVLSNCTLKDGKIDYTYKKPFDILAKGLNIDKNWRRRDSNSKNRF